MCLRDALKKLFSRKKNETSVSAGDLYKMKNMKHMHGAASLLFFPHGGPDIVIVGAGAAGLTCAMHLLNNGYTNIQILEAEERIGGRIYTIPFGKNVIDLGAQFVHGEIGNEVYAAVKRFNILTSSSDIYNKCQYIRSNGEIVSSRILGYLKEASSYLFTGEISDVNVTLREYIKTRFSQCLNALSIEKSVKSSEIADEYLANLMKTESAEADGGLEEVSLKSLLNYKTCPGDYLLTFKEKGFVNFLRILIKANEENMFGELEGRIKFGNTVEYVDWSHSDGKARIKSRNDPQIRLADHVVITVSLGVLKQCADTLFEPPLPLTKKRAVATLGFSSIFKIYIEFATIFWNEEWKGFAALWRKQDLQYIRGTEYAWLEGVFGVYRVKYQPRVLEARIVSTDVASLENLPQETIKNGILRLLRTFLRALIIPDPIAIQVTRWSSKENFLGAYSFRSMSTEQAHVTAEDLQSPLETATRISKLNMLCRASHTREEIMKPVVLFAGEATSEEYFSTVHGAVESGYREANRIIKFYADCVYGF